MKSVRLVCAPLIALLFLTTARSAQNETRVQQATAHGVLEGVVSADGKVRAFKGIPYAAPPTGSLRWRPPQPVVPWTGVRDATKFGPRAMQGRIYGDMIFRDEGPSEDCLHLNLWLPASPDTNKMPVMVWIHGGGFVAGASSEPRQDGGNLCQKGVIVVSLNYRMGVFGFLAHPELTAESPQQASGNYGLLDQVAALQWVHDNIATFGGDPDNVTIFGESAGAESVCELLASPLSRGLFQRAIAQSGSGFKAHDRPKTRAQAEAVGVRFATTAFGAPSLEALRARSASEILEAAFRLPQSTFKPIVDGWFLPADCPATYAAGTHHDVPLLAGWNRDENSHREFFAGEKPTLANYVTRARETFGDRADRFLELYPASTDAEAKRAAQDFASDRSRATAMWVWLELHLQQGVSPVYRFRFEQTLPLTSDAAADAEPVAPHAGEIEYVFRMLPARDLPWRQEDRQVSELMADTWTNFVKTGNPNGPGLPVWPAYGEESGFSVMHLRPAAVAAPDADRARHEFVDSLFPVR